MKYKYGKVKIVCLAPNTCEMEKADIWCIVEGKICPNLQLGFEE